ncbi:MAG: 50S ribosomal protein L23 [Kiritimatiellae bacterium]|nr:50S ribosomal protein L23 [Kiritimatiellia bacterium]
MAKAIIKRVLLSEKGAKLAALNQYFLEVDTKASKPEIRQAVEAKFGVHVLAVRTANMKGGLRTIRGTRRQETESTWKRAIVTVKAGERIETL